MRSACAMKAVLRFVDGGAAWCVPPQPLAQATADARIAVRTDECIDRTRRCDKVRVLATLVTPGSAS